MSMHNREGTTIVTQQEKLETKPDKQIPKQMNNLF